MNSTGSPREIGFTGSRHGMTPLQIATIVRLLEQNPEWGIVHHGARAGADTQMDTILADMGREAIVHPASRRFSTHTGDLTPSEARRVIVNASDVLLAAPAWTGTGRRALSSMTRYAKQHGVPVIVIWPDGSTSE